VKKVLILNKKEGETPLFRMESFRSQYIKKNKLSKEEKEKINKIKMTYAGRLDPMASGLLVVLTGDETKNKEKYLKLDKEYEFEVLFGVATDTYDILGKVVRQDLTTSHKSDLWLKKDLEKKVKANLKYFTGKFIQKYPVYSSKTVNGKQLFVYARNGEDVELPMHQVLVKSLKFIKLRKINSKKLLENIEKRIQKVQGDFRQKEIIKIWQKILKTSRGLVSGELFLASFKIKCSSGTYVRSIANNLGEKIGTGALAYSIKRTKIGKWHKEE
jgi:tRNA pseudouridine55 synthase